MSDLWVAATADVEAETAQRYLAAARVNAQPVWSFLTSAASREDFENRRALAAAQLDVATEQAVGGHVAHFATTRVALEDSIIEDFEKLHEQRQREAQARNARRAAVLAEERERRKAAEAAAKKVAEPKVQRRRRSSRHRTAAESRIIDGRRVWFWRTESGQEIRAAGPDDNGPAQDMSPFGGYDPACSACWLGRAHTVQYHEQSVAKGVDDDYRGPQGIVARINRRFSSLVRTAGWNFQEGFGWYLNPVDTDGRHWAKIEGSGAGYVLMIYELAPDAETQADTLVHTSTHSSLGEAQEAAESYFGSRRRRAIKEYQPRPGEYVIEGEEDDWKIVLVQNPNDTYMWTWAVFIPADSTFAVATGEAYSMAAATEAARVALNARTASRRVANEWYAPGQPANFGRRYEGQRSLNTVGDKIYGYELDASGNRRRARVWSRDQQDQANAWLMEDPGPRTARRHLAAESKTPYQMAKETLETQDFFRHNLDLQTANAIVTVYEALSPESRESFDKLSVERAAEIAWRLVRRASRIASRRVLAEFPPRDDDDDNGGEDAGGGLQWTPIDGAEAAEAVEAQTPDGGSVYATKNSTGTYHWGGSDAQGNQLPGGTRFATLDEAKAAAEAAVNGGGQAPPQQATALRRRRR